MLKTYTYKLAYIPLSLKNVTRSSYMGKSISIRQNPPFRTSHSASLFMHPQCCRTHALSPALGGGECAYSTAVCLCPLSPS